MQSHSAFLFPFPEPLAVVRLRSDPCRSSVIVLPCDADPINPIRSRADAHEAGLRRVRRFFLEMVETIDDARLALSVGTTPARSARKLRPLAQMPN